MDTSFIETVQACLANGERLLCDVRLLSDPDERFYEEADVPWKPTSLALAILAEEEFAKGFLLCWWDKGLFHGAMALDMPHDTIRANICFRR